jgi:integrase
MKNHRVNLTKRITVEGQRMFVPVKLDNRGRVTNLIDLKGEGKFYLDWYEGTKRFRTALGTDLEAALAAQERKQAERTATEDGIEVPTAGEGQQLTLRGAINTYLAEVKATKKPKTYFAYSRALDLFAMSCTKLYLATVNRSDLLHYHAYLRNECGQSPRSCWNKFAAVVSFLKANGIRGLVQKNDWPRYTEETPDVYEKDDLAKFFEECSAEELLWFKFYLMTGMREQEVMYSYWKDVNLTKKLVRVTYKPDRGWSPKAYREREIPIPDELCALLKQHQGGRDKKCELLFPTAGCRPKLDFLDACKRVAERAGLEGDWFLHKFRSTAATWWLWAGADLRTVQAWLGHSDLESTMRYLRPKPHDASVRGTVNAAF